MKENLTEHSYCSVSLPITMDNESTKTAAGLIEGAQPAVYPIPRIPMAPILSAETLSRSKECAIPAIDEHPNLLDVTSGRVAIALALLNAGIGNGDEVLVPAYHCLSMVEPIRFVGATPRFYSLHPDLSANYTSIDSSINSRCKALILTHYFGFAQSTIPARKFCDDNRIILIEDCAHTFFGVRDNIAIGSLGDYVIASTMKFFPVYDGGILASSHQSLRTLSRSNNKKLFEIKAFMTVLERSTSYKRFGVPGKLLNLTSKLKDSIWSGIKSMRIDNAPLTIGPDSADGGFHLDPAWLHAPASAISRYIVNHADRNRLIERRRNNYRRLLHLINNIPRCRPLYPDLPDNTVPLVFPFDVDHADNVADMLRRKGLPLWRFGEYLDPELDTNLCPIANEYSRRLLQIPCHQELNETDMSWLITTLQDFFE